MRRVVFLAAALASTAAIGWAQPASRRYRPAVALPSFQDAAIDEASGMAASRRNPGVVWVHNDSGARPLVYAVDRRGRTAAVYRLGGARARDWEDMAYGPGPNGRGSFLYVGDIGDNGRRRTDCAVYRLPEPKIGASSTNVPAVRRAFRYPDGPHNAEALLVHPKTGVVYIVTKEESGVAGVYKFPPEKPGEAAPVTLTRVGTVRIAGESHFFPNLVTGGDISPDGRRVALCTYAAAYELTLPAGARDFDAIWKTRPAAVVLPFLPQCEAICYTPDGKSLLVTSEQAPAPFYRLDAR